MRFQKYLIEEEKYISELTYEEYCVLLDSICLNEGVVDTAKNIAYGVLSEIKNIINEISRLINISIEEILRAFKDREFFSLLKAFRFSFKNMFKVLTSLSNIISAPLYAAFREIHKLKLFQKLQSGTITIDEILNKYPILKKLTGPPIAGLMLFIWINYTFFYSMDFDYDVSDIIDALAGRYSVEDFLGSPRALMNLSLLFVGFSTGISFVWMSTKLMNLVLGILYTLFFKSGNSQVLSRLKSVVQIGGLAR